MHITNSIFNFLHVSEEEDIHSIVGCPEPGLVMEEGSLERDGDDCDKSKDGGRRLPQAASTGGGDKRETAAREKRKN